MEWVLVQFPCGHKEEMSVQGDEDQIKRQVQKMTCQHCSHTLGNTYRVKNGVLVDMWGTPVVNKILNEN